MDKTNQQSINSGSSISAGSRSEDWQPDFFWIIKKSKSQAIVLPHPWSLDFLRLQLRICSLLLQSPRAVQLPSHHKSTSDRHHYSVYLTLVLLDINHHFARCSTLPMIEFNLKKLNLRERYVLSPHICLCTYSTSTDGRLLGFTWPNK